MSAADTNDVHEGNGEGKGRLYCGRRFTSTGGCACKHCDGCCGPTNGCQCPTCVSLWVRLVSNRSLRCPNGHLLRVTTISDIEKQSQSMIIVCDGCGQRSNNMSLSNKHAPFLHCSLCPNGFDYCTACCWEHAKIAIPTCPKGHGLISMAIAMLISKEPEYRTGVVCDECGAKGFGPIDKINHCSICKYDLCASCTLLMKSSPCPRCKLQNAFLIQTTLESIQRHSGEYNGGFICNVCGKHGHDISEHIKHCYTCEYDICQDCMLISSTNSLKISTPPSITTTPTTSSVDSTSNSALNDENSCIVCFANERQIVFLPCNHFICCASCSDRVQQCPKCRAAIGTKIKIFK